MPSIVACFSNGELVPQKIKHMPQHFVPLWRFACQEAVASMSPTAIHTNLKLHCHCQRRVWGLSIHALVCDLAPYDECTDSVWP